MKRFGLMSILKPILIFTGVYMSGISSAGQILYDTSAMPRIDMHSHISTENTPFLPFNHDPNSFKRAMHVMRGSNLTIYVSLNGNDPDWKYSQDSLEGRVLFAPGTYYGRTKGRLLWSGEDMPAFKEKGYLGLKYRVGSNYFSETKDLDQILDAQEKAGLPCLGVHIGQGADEKDYSYSYVPDAIKVIRKHPHVTFVMAHGFYLMHDDVLIDTLGKYLDELPNLFVELANCSQRWGGFTDAKGKYFPPISTQKYHDFISKYKTRLLFGTDYMSLQLYDYRSYANEYDIFETDKPQIMPFSRAGKPVHGLNLPLDVLNCYFWWNAANLLPGVKKELISLGYETGDAAPAPIEMATVKMLRSMCEVKSPKIVQAAANVGANISIAVKNPFTDARTIMLDQMPLYGSKWKISGLDSKINLEPGSTEKLSFKLTFSGTPDDVRPFPKIRVTVPVSQSQKFVFGCAIPIDEKTYLPKYIPSVVCPKLKDAPRLDGSFYDSIWKKCALSGDFKIAIDAKPSKNQTKFRTGYDEKNLYVAINAEEPAMPGLVARAQKPDDPLMWGDDCLEIFIDTKLDRKTYFHFAMNAVGIVYKGRKADNMVEPDSKWNGEIQAASRKMENGWVVFAAIPFKTLETAVPPKGTKYGFEVARFRAQRPRENSQWSPTLASNHTPERFGVLEFK